MPSDSVQDRDREIRIIVQSPRIRAERVPWSGKEPSICKEAIGKEAICRERIRLAGSLGGAARFDNQLPKGRKG